MRQAAAAGLGWASGSSAASVTSSTRLGPLETQRCATGFRRCAKGEPQRCDPSRPSRPQAWHRSWLEILAEGEPLAPELLPRLGSQNRGARAVMSAPVITVNEETSLREVAETLTTQRIKRVPVVTDGRLVGIVSCADLVRALSVSLDKSAAEVSA